MYIYQTEGRSEHIQFKLVLSSWRQISFDTPFTQAGKYRLFGELPHNAGELFSNTCHCFKVMEMDCLYVYGCRRRPMHTRMWPRFA